MKKKILCGILVGTTILCTACQSPNPDKAMSLQEEIPEVLANAEYENLEILFDEMEYYEGQELAIAHMERYDLYANFTYKELMEYYANEVFPRLLDVETMDTTLLFDDDSWAKLPGAEESICEKNYNDIMETIGEYTSAPEVVYIDKENWIEVNYTFDWIGGVYISMGGLGQYAQSTDALAAKSVIETEKTYNCRTDDLSDSYMLLDGEKTVAEAKAEMESYLNSHYPIGGRENNIGNIINEISVGKIKGTDYYAFKASRTLSYNGIPFREMPSTHSEPKGETVIMAECAMCESDKVDVTIGIINMFTTPEVTRVIENPMSFQEVMDRVAYYLTGATKFQMLHGGLEYRLMNEETGYEMIPYWCFIAKDTNDESMIKIYVNIETGETTHSKY